MGKTQGPSSKAFRFSWDVLEEERRDVTAG
jgi:hypothetical protein